MVKSKTNQTRWFVVAETDEVCNRIEIFVRGITPRSALEKFASKFPPKGGECFFPLLFADLYANADSYHSGMPPLITLNKESEYYRKNNITHIPNYSVLRNSKNKKVI